MSRDIFDFLSLYILMFNGQNSLLLAVYKCGWLVAKMVRTTSWRALAFCDHSGDLRGSDHHTKWAANLFATTPFMNDPTFFAADCCFLLVVDSYHQPLYISRCKDTFALTLCVKPLREQSTNVSDSERFWFALLPPLGAVVLLPHGWSCNFCFHCK